jgi:hypothetical protein
VQWFEQTFTNPVTININVGYGEVNGQSLSSSALGESITNINPYNYSQVHGALSGLPSTDPANGNYWLSNAEAKAIGLPPSGSSTDGSVGFASAANLFAYDNSNGVPLGQYDFMGVVAHEISEVLGRFTLDGTTSINNTPAYSALDLFHFSAPGVRVLSGTTPGYFSIDNGTSNLGNFNTDPRGDFGDWASTVAVGNDAFLAFANSGVKLPVSTNDVTELSALGWTVSPACYCRGTLIVTARGEVAVEDLELGNKLVTAAGALRSIKWIGRRSYSGRFVLGDKDILPVCIKTGAIADNVPRRDLWISPHHAMCLEGVLIEEGPGQRRVRNPG